MLIFLCGFQTSAETMIDGDWFSNFRQMLVSTEIRAFLLPLIAAAFATLLLLKRSSKLPLPPGPRGFPFFGNSLQLGRSFNHLLLRDLANVYGDVMCLKVGLQHVVIISSPELAREVLQSKGDEFAFRARSIVESIFTGDGKDVAFGDDSEHWRLLRRIISTPFKKNWLQQYWSAFEESVHQAVLDLGTQSSEEPDGILVKPRLELMMYNLVYYLLFGWTFESQQDPLFAQLRALNEQRKLFVFMLDLKYGDFIPGYLKPFVWRHVRSCKRIKEQSVYIFKNLINEHRKGVGRERRGQASEKFAIDFILEAEKKGEISEEDMLYLVVNINIAAIDTTLVPVDWIVAELANNSQVQQKLREELVSVLGEGVRVTESSLPSLPYLQAVVKETLRLHTPVPLLLPHKNFRPAQLGGYHIPAGSKILVNAWLLANNPRHWDKPQVFSPDRFMKEKLEITGKDFRFVPFGSGRRYCPGSTLAFNMMCVLVGMLVQEYEIRPPEGKNEVDLAPFCTELFHGLAKKPYVSLKALQKQNQLPGGRENGFNSEVHSISP